MPGGVPVATVAIGKAGATNAGLLAAAMLGIHYPHYMEALKKRREMMRKSVMESSDHLV